MSRFKKTISKLKKVNFNGKTLENCPLSDKTTYRCGGNARVLLEINTLENFLCVMQVVEEENLSYFVLGGGSNTLVSDEGYDGVVIMLGGDLSRIEKIDDTAFECGGGVRLASAYVHAYKMGLSGLEDSAGIPATIGGAVCMNAGAYNFEMSKIVEYVTAYHEGKIEYFDNEKCSFGYRDSIFQHDQYIILRVGLRLVPMEKEVIGSRYREVLQKRSLSQPLDMPSGGCVFRRQDGIVVSKILDECGLKGLTLGGGQVSTKHANFVVNKGGALAQDIYEITEIMSRRVFNKTGVRLHREIKLLGEFDEVTW